MTKQKIHVEVYIASQLLARHQETFTKAELSAEIERRFGDARDSVSAHIGAHCVANARKSAARVYCYLWREERGLFLSSTRIETRRIQRGVTALACPK